MILSLVLPTIHRVKEVEAFLASLDAQDLPESRLKEVEVIVVDQNADGRLDDLTREGRWPRFVLKRLRIPPKGLSNARNQGLALIQGPIVAFPDDDCTYAPDTLGKVLHFFESGDGKRALFIRGVDPKTGEDFLRYPKAEMVIHSPRDPRVFLGISISQFYPKEAVKAVGDFDEELGIGARWGSGEETDYALRVLEKGFSIHFRPDIRVFHEKVSPLAQRDIPVEKVRVYSRGFGALCRKHGFELFLVGKVLKQLAGVLYFAIRLDLRRSAICWVTATARLQGSFGYVRAKKGPLA